MLLPIKFIFVNVVLIWKLLGELEQEIIINVK